ncbi:MAG: zf-TFIIB domain-containing protein [Acidobacteria bacterium]|nr:zf-TFIIB domain-containing protein [Acidobacteriota bacterium]
MSDSFDSRRKGLEEEYVRRKDREALDKLRREMAAEAEATGQAAARQCPLGHGALAEVRHDEVVIDRCNTCGGVWLDAGELEHLTEREEGGWFSRFRGK